MESSTMSSTFTVEARFLRQRLFELNIHAFAADVGHLIEKFGVDLVGGFQVGFVILARIFRQDLFALFLARLEEVPAFGQAMTKRSPWRGFSPGSFWLSCRRCTETDKAFENPRYSPKPVAACLS